MNEVDSYLEVQPEDARVILEKIRLTIKKAAPEAEEVISYQMPSFRFNGMLVWYAAFKEHYSVFFIPRVIEAFKEELKPYKLTKSAIKFPMDHPVPVQLITKMVKFGAIINYDKAQLKIKVKKR
jgi:uncharacterized protein YdhG (YjbR/CyaY superfamily)